jgi:hypothetical protein
VAGAPGNGPRFLVIGTNTYSHPGTYTISITIRDLGGARASATSRANVPESPPPPPPPPQLPAPHVTMIAALPHSRKGLSALTVSFDEPLTPGSASNPRLYSIFGAVRKRKQTVFAKSIALKTIVYDGKTQVSITLARPYLGVLQVTVRGTLVAANGATSATSFTRVIT